MLDERAGQGSVEDCVGKRWSERTPVRQTVGESENVMVQRMETALVALREKFRLVRGDVDLHRAFGFAGLATETQIERFVNGLTLEALFAQRSGKHLPQQPRAAAGGVLLLTGGGIAGTPQAAFGLAACADTDAALGGALKRSSIGGKGEVRLERFMRLTGQGR